MNIDSDELQFIKTIFETADMSSEKFEQLKYDTIEFKKLTSTKAADWPKSI